MTYPVFPARPGIVTSAERTYRLCRPVGPVGVGRVIGNTNQAQSGWPCGERLTELEEHRLVAIRVTEVTTIEHVRNTLPWISFVAAAEFERLCM